MFNSFKGEKTLTNKLVSLKLNEIKSNNNGEYNIKTLQKQFDILKEKYSNIDEVIQRSHKTPPLFGKTDTDKITDLSISGLKFLKTFQDYLKNNKVELNGKSKTYLQILMGIQNNKTQLIPTLLQMTLNLVDNLSLLNQGCIYKDGMLKKGILCGDKKINLEVIYNTFIIKANNTTNKTTNKTTNNNQQIQMDKFMEYIVRLDDIFEELKK